MTDTYSLHVGESSAERCRDGESRKRNIALGLATEEEYEKMATAWEQWIAAEDGSLGIMNGELIIRK